MGESKVDFVMITAIELERQAICRAFGMGDKHRKPKGLYTYWRKQLKLDNNQFYEIAVTQLPDVASVDAALAAATAINEWQPRAVLMVGIAGAARETVQLGDLVLGQEVYYYERGKDTLTGRLPEPKQYPANEVLWSRVSTIASEKLSRWRSSLPQKPDGADTSPKIHYGVIASGNRVIANAEIRDEIAANNRKIDAIEMEGYGVSAAAWKREIPVPCLVIRAISDRADAQKNDVWQPYAAAVAAKFTKYFLLDQPLPPLNQPLIPIAPYSTYNFIIDALKTGSVVPFLGSGINPHFYIALATEFAADFVEQALIKEDEEYALTREELITKLIGIPCATCHYWPKDRPDTCPMLKIAGTKDCPLYIEQELSVSMLNLRYLSEYYLLKTDSSTALFTKLDEILEKIEQQYTSNALHQFLAQLPRLMYARNYPKRNPGLPYQLIVTTNYDNGLEQAFLKAKQPYDVVFYVVDEDEGGKFKHQPYEGVVRTIDTSEYSELPLRGIGQSGNQAARPIILKLFGSWNPSSENSFVVTDRQRVYLVDALKSFLPTSLCGILADSSVLFLGYSPSDLDLNRLMNCLWPDKIKKKSWLLHQAQPGHLEQEIWRKRNVDLLKIPSLMDEFITQLKQGIEASISATL